MADTPDDRPGRGHLRLVRGNATPEEIAALVAVLAAARPTPPARTRSTWADPALAMRGGIVSGAGAWARSGRTAGMRSRPGG